jgi:hypothetical protein
MGNVQHITQFYRELTKGNQEGNQGKPGTDTMLFGTMFDNAHVWKLSPQPHHTNGTLLEFF